MRRVTRPGAWQGSAAAAAPLHRGAAARCPLLALVAALATAGCMIGPSFKPPAAPLAARWSEHVGTDVDQSREEYRSWWKVFDDPVLEHLIGVFLVLAAQYESWSDPAVVVLVVPIAIVGVIVALFLRRFPIDLYTQIGLVLIIALAAKNAILIVEFARELRAEGMDAVAAAVEATRRRFRPILMTSIAFILGVVPLLVASGAGAASQQAIGTVVFGGMLASTLLAIPFVPVFYVAVHQIADARTARRPASPGEETATRSEAG